MARVPVKMEFLFRASPTIIYQFLTTPSCLIRWFCDDVEIEEDSYTFFWGGAGETAEILEDVEEEKLRFHWEGAAGNEYWEYNIKRSPVTSETSVIITDFCDEGEQKDQYKLWESQMNVLRSEMGG